MIQINIDNITEVVIYKSNLNYNGTYGTYGITLINDLSKEVVTLNFNTYVDNDRYTSFLIPSNSISEYGFYTLNILLNSEIVYTERAQLNRKKNIGNDYIDKTKIITKNYIINDVVRDFNGTNTTILV